MRAFLALSLVATLAPCGPAFGATTVSVAKSDVLITDESGERNALTVTVAGAIVTITETAAPLEAGDGCEIEQPDTVRCETDGHAFVRAHLADGRDIASVSPDEGGSPACDCVRLHGGPGEDGLSGGEGVDYLEGGEGEDFLVGRGGRDILKGGFGPDELDDGDRESGQIGPDIVIGGRDVDTVYSYLDRTEGVRVDLTDGLDSTLGDGQENEGDALVNVEIVEGGDGNDRLIGDGDSNALYGGDGTDRLDGGGGADGLFDYDANRNKLNGGQGGDTLVVTRFGTGPVRCGRGLDQVSEDPPGRDEPQGGEGLRGPWISGTCEAIGFGIDPVPDEPVSRRSIAFGVSPGGRPDEDFYLAVSGVSEPFTGLGRGNVTQDGVTVRLPADIAERARRDGFQFRADLNNPENSRRRMVWRFRQKPAR